MSGLRLRVQRGPLSAIVTAATRWPGTLFVPPATPAIWRRPFFERCAMSDASKRAEHYRDLAERYLRLAASTENPNHYLRIAVQYNTLAETEELRRRGHANGK